MIMDAQWNDAVENVRGESQPSFIFLILGVFFAIFSKKIGQRVVHLRKVKKAYWDFHYEL